MAEMEPKKIKLAERLEYLTKKLGKKYQLVDDAGVRFATDHGVVFFLTGLRDFNSVVVEYAASAEEAALNRFEDGDLFNIDELTEEEMLAAIISEIEAG